MTSIFASRTQQIAAVVVFAALGAIGFLPLFGGPGYELSLASGLLVPSVAAIATAIEVSRAEGPPVACVVRGIVSGLFLAAIAFATALLHGLSRGICDFWGAAAFFVLTAGFGAVLGGTWGALAGEACRGRRHRKLYCVVIALAAPAAGVVISLARFYGSPMIFAFDPFFGYFSGALYDTVIDVRTALWSYRAGSLAALVGVLLVAASLERTPDGRLRLGIADASDGSRASAGRRLPRRLRLAVAGLVALAVALGVSAEGPALGHWQTAATIAAALGGRASGPRCDVFFPDSLPPAQSTLLVRDCEEELEADERRLGAHLDGRLSAYVFRDAEQKRMLMGAAETSIAKPWRREVYVQLAAYPHPALGHEIAHVVAGSFARWPFRVGGGLWPNPGLIEGLAVATSPDDDALTAPEWASAMLKLGVLPPIERVFSLGFLTQSADKSYTVAGAFVAWVRMTLGAGAVRAWYGGRSIEAISRERWPTLDDGFRTWLRAQPMPPSAMAYASARFERPSVWQRRCPHVVDTLDRDADQCTGESRFARASALYARALVRDPHDWHASLARAQGDIHEGDGAQGRAKLEALADDPGAPRTWRDRAQEALADDDFARGLFAPASASYRDIASRTLNEDVARELAIKVLGVEGDPLARGAIRDLLIGDRAGTGAGAQSGSRDPFAAGLSLGEWWSTDHHPVAAYLIGKNLARREGASGWARAAVWLDRALALGIEEPHIGRELLRQRAIAACAEQDGDAIERVKGAIVAKASPFEGGPSGRRNWVLGLIDRCTID